MKITKKSLMFVKNCAPCGRLFASPEEEGGREGGTLLADGLSPLLLLLLLLFLPLFLPPAHTQLLYIQPSSIQPRGFHDRKRALSSLSPQIGIPPGRLTPLSPFSVSRNFGIHPRGYPIHFVSFIPFFVKCKHALFFFPFVSPPICVRGYHRNVFLSLLGPGGERGGDIIWRSNPRPIPRTWGISPSSPKRQTRLRTLVSPVSSSSPER